MTDCYCASDYRHPSCPTHGLDATAPPSNLIGYDRVAEACRNSDAEAGEHGIEAFVTGKLGVRFDALANAAQQRGLRALLAMQGRLTDELGGLRNHEALRVSVTDEEVHLPRIAWMDGFAVGVKLGQMTNNESQET